MKKQKTVLHLKKFRIANLNRFSIQGGEYVTTAPSGGDTSETVDTNTHPLNTYLNDTSCDGFGYMNTTCGTEGRPRSLNGMCQHNNNNYTAPNPTALG